MNNIEILEDEFLEIIGAREHNLKSLNLKIPRNQLVVITGLSGSGKSSLAFDTIYAEGQRRYIESFGSYARQFLGSLERPEVDKITGLSPVISIEQKTVNKNPRSTVGTITEIYDFLRLLFARIGEAYSYKTGEKMVQYSDKQIIEHMLTKFKNKKVLLLSPVIKGRKGHYRELFEQIRKQGFTKVKIDGEIVDITPNMRIDRYKVHDIEIVIDRLKVSDEIKKRIDDSLQTCMKHGKGSIIVQDFESDKSLFFSRSLMCPTTGISYDKPAPNSFSFNSPYGACPACNGLGTIAEISLNKVIPNPELSIKKGGIAPIGEYKKSWIFNQIDTISKKFNFKLTTPIQDLPEEAINTVLFGSEESFSVELSDTGVTKTYNINFEGVINFVTRQYKEKPSQSLARWAQSFMNKNICSTCNGARLKTESLFFKIDEKNIAELASMDISDFSLWFSNIESRLTKNQNIIAKEILKEIRNRSRFLL
ncbi:MAG: excinuclease ABC subunit UvrA, partial [Flavobacteriales bacterium]|nr:excinuclease ABC subunit UvrA [Flavobacteriales bacterium]